MKFYVISIILTVTALFVPVIQPAIAGAGEDTIAVSLESLESMDGDDAGGGNGMELPEGGGGSGGIPQTEQKQAAQKREEVAKNTQAEKLVNSNKTANTNESSSNMTKSAGSESTGQDITGNSGVNGGRAGSPGGDGTGGTPGGKGKEGGTGSKGSGNNPIGKNPDPAPKTTTNYGCVNGKGYKMVTKPKIKLNRAQTLTIPSGTRVTVNGAFSANGSLNVSGVSGGNAEAQRLARNAASGIKVNVIDKTITKCNVTITYTLAE